MSRAEVRRVDELKGPFTDRLRPEPPGAVLSVRWPIGFLASERGYARLWAVTLLSGLSAFLTRGAIYVWVAQQWPVMDAAATLVLAEGLAALAAAPLAGRLIERAGQRAVMIAGDLIRCAVLLAALSAFVWPVACAAFFLLAGVGVLHQAARDTMVRDVVSYDGSARASGLDQIASHFAIAAGPLIGTLLTVGAGIAVALAAAAAGHLLAAGLARGLPRGTAPDVADEALQTATRAASGRRTWFMLTFGSSVVAAGLWLSAAPAVLSASAATDVARLYGLQIAAAGAAALLGSIVAPALVERWGSGRVFGLAGATEAVAMSIYALCGKLPVMNAMIVAIGFGAATMSTAFYTRLQQDTAAAMRGRTFGLVRQLDAGGILFAGLMGMLLSPALPASALLAAVAAVYLALALRFGVRRDAASRAPAGDAGEH